MMRSLKNTFYLLILLLGSCTINKESKNISEKLKGNIFDLTSSAHNQKLTIEFKDSTYTIYEGGVSNLEWYTSSSDKNTIILDRNKVKMQELNDSVYKGVFISDEHTKIQILLTKRKPIWNEELLDGIWMTSKTFEIFGYATIEDKNLLSDLFEIPEGRTKSEFEPYQIFKIDKGKLVTKLYYDSIVSEFDVIKNDWYMALDLKNNKIFEGRYLKIMSQKDSLLYYDLTNKVNGTNDSTMYGLSKLIKIR